MEAGSEGFLMNSVAEGRFDILRKIALSRGGDCAERKISVIVRSRAFEIQMR